ncbi:potassium channel family protein [Vulcanisaeta distributa]|uniref:Ion transport 2 domain protein n=1 Tax=Vulcanisaeta distributa (strain DSM 14429 / JCM 11212 / NBRC 100878 / IC-017) TaxID=572478 RepID=E1QQ16_VULDI|nr:ion channel [Vulcanisaeta distributa]ADN50388.1 Ion transport 2 domain protein [Vulcanisaeta distributa DSM 14429]
MIIPITFLKFLRKIRKIARSTILYSLILFLIILFVGALAMYLIEHGKNPGFNNYFNAVWFVMETITTVGYGDVVPNTYLGKLVDMIIMPVGIATISLLTASIATELTNVAIMRSVGHHTTSKGRHIIVIGDSDKALKVISIIEELMNRRGKVMDILYISNGDKPPSLPADIEFIRGDPFNTNDLLRAGADRASTVVILPFNDADVKAADAKVILLIMSIRKLNPNAYIIAEVLNEADRDYALRAGANSVISLGSFTTVMIANEVFDRGLSSVLINIVNRGNLGLMDADEYVGRQFIEVMQLVKSRLNYLVIGVVRGGEVILNPGNDLVIQSGDSLLVIK